MLTASRSGATKALAPLYYLLRWCQVVYSLRAGKLEALEYVRTLYGVPRERCVAAGDSGNDILMLEGEVRKFCILVFPDFIVTINGLTLILRVA